MGASNRLELVVDDDAGAPEGAGGRPDRSQVVASGIVPRSGSEPDILSLSVPRLPRESRESPSSASLFAPGFEVRDLLAPVVAPRPRRGARLRVVAVLAVGVGVGAGAAALLPVLGRPADSTTAHDVAGLAPAMPTGRAGATQAAARAPATEELSARATPIGAAALVAPASGGAVGGVESVGEAVLEPRGVRAEARGAIDAPARVPGRAPRNDVSRAAGERSAEAGDEQPMRADEVVEEATAVVPATPVEPSSGPDALPAGTPDVPDRDTVRSVMAQVQAEVAECAAGRHGLSRVLVTVDGSGRVRSARVEGALSGSAEGSCVARAVRTLWFPRFAQPSFSFSFPYQL